MRRRSRRPAPRWEASFPATTATISLSGTFINDGAGTTTIADVDNGAVVGGIALVGATGNGTWEYSLDNGVSFDSLGTISDSSALLLPNNAELHYTPSGTDSEDGHDHLPGLGHDQRRQRRPRRSVPGVRRRRHDGLQRRHRHRLAVWSTMLRSLRRAVPPRHNRRGYDHHDRPRDVHQQRRRHNHDHRRQPERRGGRNRPDRRHRQRDLGSIRSTARPSQRGFDGRPFLGAAAARRRHAALHRRTARTAKRPPSPTWHGTPPAARPAGGPTSLPPTRRAAPLPSVPPTDAASLTVTSVNDAPVLTPANPALGSTTPAAATTISLAGTFINNGAGTTTITDVDNGGRGGRNRPDRRHRQRHLGLLARRHDVHRRGHGLRRVRRCCCPAPPSCATRPAAQTAKRPRSPTGRGTPPAAPTATRSICPRAAAIGGTTAFSPATDTASLVVNDAPRPDRRPTPRWEPPTRIRPRRST